MASSLSSSRGTPPGPPAVSLQPDDTRRQTEADVLRSLVDGLIAEDLFGFRSRGRWAGLEGRPEFRSHRLERWPGGHLAGDEERPRRVLRAVAGERLAQPPDVLARGQQPVHGAEGVVRPAAEEETDRSVGTGHAPRRRRDGFRQRLERTVEPGEILCRDLPITPMWIDESHISMRD